MPSDFMVKTKIVKESSGDVLKEKKSDHIHQLEHHSHSLS